jgi:peptidoglycan hydrolase-like protein with peptidoglycan-binding domain
MGINFNISDEYKQSILESHNNIKTTTFLKEQTEEMNYKKAIQCFLNKKGITDDEGKELVVDGRAGEKTEQAVSKYQSMIKVFPADGKFGPSTSDKMPEEDKEILKECISEHGDFIDKLTRFFGLN